MFQFGSWRHPSSQNTQIHEIRSVFIYLCSLTTYTVYLWLAVCVSVCVCANPSMLPMQTHCCFYMFSHFYFVEAQGMWRHKDSTCINFLSEIHNHFHNVDFGILLVWHRWHRRSSRPLPSLALHSIAVCTPYVVSNSNFWRQWQRNISSFSIFVFVFCSVCFVVKFLTNERSAEKDQQKVNEKWKIQNEQQHQATTTNNFIETIVAKRVEERMKVLPE